MGANGVTDGNGRMLEVAVDITLEAQSFHQFTRAKVDCCRERYDFVEIERLKAEFEHLKGRAISETAPPEFRAESPADFRAGHERSGKRWSIEAAKSRKDTVNLDGPQAPTSLIEGSALTFKGGNAFVTGEKGWEIAHHLRVGIHRDEWFEIRVFPVAQEEAFHCRTLKGLNRKIVKSLSRGKAKAPGSGGKGRIG